MFFNKLMLLTSSVAESVPEVSNDSGGNTGSWLSSLSPILMLAVFAAVFYFVLIRPEKKRKKQAQEQRDAMKVGDTVVTIGGITGEIESIRNETITIFTGNCSMDVQKWAVRTVEADELDGDEYKTDDEEAVEDEGEAAENGGETEE